MIEIKNLSTVEGGPWHIWGT